MYADERDAQGGTGDVTGAGGCGARTLTRNRNIHRPAAGESPVSFSMDITVNGKRHELSESLTLEAVLRSLAVPHGEGGIAVALNGELVRRADWSRQQVRAGDALEIVQATQGG